MTTPQPRTAACPTAGCVFGHLHTGLCRDRNARALIAANTPSGIGIHPAPAPGGFLAAVAERVPTTGPAPAPADDEPAPFDPTADAPWDVVRSIDPNAPDVSPGYALWAGALLAGDFGPRLVGPDAPPAAPGEIRLPLPAPAVPGDEIVPYTPAQQYADLRKALETPCTCGQPSGHLIGCPRRLVALHEHVTASVLRGEIDAPLSLGTEHEGLLYYWHGALLGWTFNPGDDSIFMEHQHCGHHETLMGGTLLRLPDIMAMIMNHMRGCGR